MPCHHSSALPSTLNLDFKRFRRVSWRTLSKAALRSRRTNKVTFCASIFNKISFFTLSSADSVLWFRTEICTNYALLAFSSLLRSIVLKQIRITPIQKTCQNFLLWWFSRDFLVSDNLAYQKCFVLQRLLYSGFLFTAILLYVYWMNRWVLVWIHFNVCKGDTQTKTLKRVFADHIQSAFSSIQVFFSFLPAFSGLFSM